MYCFVATCTLCMRFKHMCCPGGVMVIIPAERTYGPGFKYHILLFILLLFLHHLVKVLKRQDNVAYMKLFKLMTSINILVYNVCV